MMWRIILGMTIGLLAAWAMLVMFMLVARPKGSLMKEALRLLPDTLRLLRRQAADRSLPWAVRMRIWVLFVYLATPIDLVPDFIPVLGYADDVIIVSVALRSVVRRAGPDVMRLHWPGTEDGLATLRKIVRLAEDVAEQ